MEKQHTEILIFRSNILTEGDRRRVSPVFDSHPQIEQWCVDMDDEDRVLRVVSSKLKQNQIIDMVSKCGYTCEELND